MMGSAPSYCYRADMISWAIGFEDQFEIALQVILDESGVHEGPAVPKEKIAKQIHSPLLAPGSS